MAFTQFRFQTVILTLLLVSASSGLGETLVGKSGSFLEPPQILPVEEVFRLSASKSGNEVKLYWQILPGYYLYKHRIKVSSTDSLGSLVIPQGKPKHDEFFGDVEVFYEELEVIVPLEQKPSAEMIAFPDLEVEYQGCADAGICYPPRKERVSP
jgi:thiol:disulfide interchange protein DsbD